MILPAGIQRIDDQAERAANYAQQLHRARQRFAEQAARMLAKNLANEARHTYSAGKHGERFRSERPGGILAQQAFVFDTLKDKGYVKAQFKLYGVSEDHLDYAYLVVVAWFSAEIKAEAALRRQAKGGQQRTTAKPVTVHTVSPATRPVLLAPRPKPTVRVTSFAELAAAFRGKGV